MTQRIVLPLNVLAVLEMADFQLSVRQTKKDEEAGEDHSNWKFILTGLDMETGKSESVEFEGETQAQLALSVLANSEEMLSCIGDDADNEISKMYHHLQETPLKAFMP